MHGSAAAAPARLTRAAQRPPKTWRTTAWSTLEWGRTPVLVGVLLAGWWLVQATQVLLVPPPDPTATVATTATAEGSLLNTVIIVAFAALGLWFWPWRRLVRDSRSARIFFVFLSAYLVWAFASLAWSVDLALSVRRLIQLACILLGCVGLGAGFYARVPNGERLFAQHVLWAGLIAAACMWLAVLKSGSVTILDPAWAAKDVGVGTRLGYPITYGILAALFLGTIRALTGWRLATTLAVLIFSLVMQKARFTIAFGLMVAAPLIVTSIRWNWRWAGVMTTAAASVWVVSALLALEGTLPLEPVTNSLYAYATLDSAADTTTSLTGRTPLWDELALYLQAKPWLGYGFGAFWNPDYMASIWAVVPWNPPVAHNGFLDEVLGTGVIGLVLILGVWLTGMFAAFARSGPFAAFIGLAMLLFLLLNVGDSIMQSYFQFPFLAALTGVSALLARRAEARAVRPRS